MRWSATDESRSGDKALNDAVRDGVLVRNPSDGVELPRAQRPEMKVWTADELRRFLRYTESHRLHAAFSLMCTSGMRRSELLGINWANVDWDSARVAVVDTVVPVDNKPVLRIGETKSKKSTRVRKTAVCSHQSTMTVVSAGMARVVCEDCGDVHIRYESMISGDFDRSKFSRDADSVDFKDGAHSKP